MNENTNTTMNTTEPTTPTPEATGGQGEKLFTQEQVNDIIRERLSRERAKYEPSPADEREAALQQREKAIEAKESRYACEDYLKEVGIIGKSRDAFLEVLDTSDFDRFKTIVDRLGGPYISKVTVTGAEVAHPPMNSGATLESRIADAFKPKI